MADKEWQCKSRVIDPRYGEVTYLVGKYRGTEPKIMRNSGAWLKVVEDHHPAGADFPFSFLVEPST